MQTQDEFKQFYLDTNSMLREMEEQINNFEPVKVSIFDEILSRLQTVSNALKIGVAYKGIGVRQSMEINSDIEEIRNYLKENCERFKMGENEYYKRRENL